MSGDLLPCECGDACRPAPRDCWTPVLIGLLMASNSLDRLNEDPTSTPTARLVAADIMADVTAIMDGIEELRRAT